MTNTDSRLNEISEGISVVRIFNKPWRRDWEILQHAPD